MKMRRRYVRNIRQNLSFYIASTVLTMAALFLFFLFHIAGNAILDFADEFFEKQKLEDAHFTTYIPIPESDIEDMEEEYGITLEAQSYINIDTDGTTARVFQKTRKVDLCNVTEGEDADEKGEVILSEGYAVNMEISIGDQIRIGEEDYTVTGFFQRPDYLYMMENEDDSYKNISTFFLAYMPEEDFAELGETNCQYLVRYNGNEDTDFRRAVNDKISDAQLYGGGRKPADCDGTLTGGNVSDHVVDASVHPASCGGGADLHHYQQKGKDRAADDRNAFCHGVHQSAVSTSLCRLCSHSRYHRRCSDFCGHGSCRPAIRGTGAY